MKRFKESAFNWFDKGVISDKFEIGVTFSKLIENSLTSTVCQIKEMIGKVIALDISKRHDLYLSDSKQSSLSK